MKRKLMAVALGASMIASMMSVGAFAEESEVVANGDYKFEIIVKSYQSSYWQAAVKGIDSEKDKLGIRYRRPGSAAEQRHQQETGWNRSGSLLTGCCSGSSAGSKRRRYSGCML